MWYFVMSVKTFVGMGFDLGANFGYCKAVCNIEDDKTIKMNVIAHKTFDIHKLAIQQESSNIIVNLSHQRIMRNIFRDIVRSLVIDNDVVRKTNLFVVEGIGFDPRRMTAGISLSIYTEILESIINNELSKRLYAISPKMTKRLVAGGGEAGKIEIRETILLNKDITILNPADASEHEFDAIANLYAGIKHLHSIYSLIL